MQPYGSDRVRVVGDKILLFSPISKGWTARVPKQGLRSEHPGTAILWNDEYFEVVSAELSQGGGVRYVLERWRDEHTIRVFDSYDPEREQQRIDDYQAALRQQKGSVAASVFSVILGHLPAAVQEKLGNDYGITPARMTLISTIPSIVLLGICVWLFVGAKLRMAAGPVPLWLWFVVLGMVLESFIRFHVAMAQNRGMGSLPGAICYVIFWYLNPNRQRLVSPFATERGQSTSFMIAAPDDVELQDALHVRAPLFTLLSPAEQHRLADRYGYDYRRHARGPAILILVFAILGVITSGNALRGDGGLAALISLVLAGGLAVEQIMRLFALRSRPAGSVLAVLVRPFARRFLMS